MSSQAQRCRSRTVVAISAAGLFLVTGCSAQSEAERSVKELLHDPDSARFSEVRPGVTPGDVCGNVNAKNVMRGYAGKTPFYYSKASGETAIVPPLEDADFRLFRLQMTSSESNRKFAALRDRCYAVQQWRAVCGSDYPTGVHRLCRLLDLGDSSALMLALDRELRP